MNLPAFAVRRPVLTTMVTLMVMVVGLVALSRLRIDMLPSIELPTLTVRTSFEGASPEVMERIVTQTLEEILATVPGVEELSSTTTEGESRIRVVFAWGTDVDAAAADLRATVEDEINELPDDITRPRVRRFDVDSFPVMLLGVRSRIDPVELTELVEGDVRYGLSRVPGVAQVDLWGGFDREIRIEVDPGRTKAHGLSLERVVAALREANLDLPAGRIVEDRYEVTLRAPARFVDLDQIRGTTLLNGPGGAVTIGQVAEVRDTWARLTRVDRIDGERGIRVAIRKQPEANTVEVTRGVIKEIDRLNRAFPQIDVVSVRNQGSFIERSISNVARSTLYGGALAVLVLLFFLRSVRSTVVIALAIPISIVATFALIYLGGFTLNLMTLGGLALGVGMMVDSSIVVLENIYRRRGEHGEAPEVAAVNGASEVATAIVASTLTTLVIFLPVVFVGGVSGALFRELALVIVFSLVCSLVVALTLVPVLAASLLRAEAPHGPIATRVGSWLDRMDRGYRAVLLRALDHRWGLVGLAFALVVGTAALVPLLGSEFLPPSDEGEVRITGEMEPGTRLGLVDAQTRKIEAIVGPAVPEAEATMARVNEAKGELELSLGASSRRARSNTEIAADLRERLDGQIPGMQIRVRAPQGQFLMERVLGNTEEGLTVEVRGFDLAILDSLAARVAQAVADLPGVADVEVSRRAGVPQHRIEVDRAKLGDLGLSPRDVTSLLQTAMAGTDAGEFQVEGDSYRILVQLADAYDRHLDEVLDLTLATASGQEVALRNLVDVVPGQSPLEIERKNQQRLVKVVVNVAGRDTGSVAGAIERRIDQIPRPAGYDLAISGSFEEQRRAARDFVVSLGLAVLLVYMVLASQYESLRRPLVVMLSVPVAGVGVVLTLIATGTTLNLQSYIGCIMLGGIVVNNAILLVDQAGRLADGGLPVREALAEAGRRRLRPILMTTLTTILGLMPLALGIGEGAEAQAPLARVVVGGLAGSTLITLVLIPAVYALMYRDRATPGP